MQFIKYCMLFLVFLSATLIGKYISQKYKFRLDELEEMKNEMRRPMMLLISARNKKS